ncbi:MAG: hypothetical protein ACJA0S_000394 [Rickettsiales bacterium]|jgi:hypothetical protein
MVIMIKKMLLIFLMISLVSCGRYWYKPYGRLFKYAPKDGTPGLELGWMHGCESGLGTQFGGSVYQSFYSWKKDPDIVKASKSPDDIRRIRERYRGERIAKINWDDQKEVRKNFNDYNAIFWGAHIFCRHSVLGQLQMSGMTPPLVDEPRYDPSAHSLGNIYKIDGKGDARYSYW